MLWQTPLGGGERLPTEMSLVKEDYAESFVPGLVELAFHLVQRLLKLVCSHVFEPLLVPDCPLFDFVELVNLPEQGRVHVSVGKLSVNLFAPVLQ